MFPIYLQATTIKYFLRFWNLLTTQIGSLFHMATENADHMSPQFQPIYNLNKIIKYNKVTKIFKKSFDALCGSIDQWTPLDTSL